MEVKEKVRKFLERFFRGQQITDDENIFESTYINSLFAMQLVTFIENEFNIEITSEDLDLEKFKSINLIADLIQSKVV